MRKSVTRTKTVAMRPTGRKLAEERRGRKKVEDPETARRILAAAERQFAEAGLEGARTDEIAAEAGVNKAMLYYYFKDKRHLHRAVLEHIFQQASASVEHGIDTGASSREKLLAFVNGYFDVRANHPHYPQLFLRLMLDSRDEVRWLARTFFRPGHQHLCRVIEEGIARGEFRPVDPGQTVITIIAMIAFYFSGAIVHSEILQHDALSPNAIAARRRAVVDFLEHALFLPEARRS